MGLYQRHKRIFFNDLQKIDTQKDFQAFCAENVLDCCFVEKDGKIIYVSYIVITGFKSVAYCVYSDGANNNISLSKDLNKIAIEYYKSRWNIDRFDCYVDTNNRISRFIIRVCGFKFLCIIPKFQLVNGVSTDYYYYILEA